MTPAAGYGLLKAVFEKAPVGQPRQGIVERLSLDRRFGLGAQVRHLEAEHHGTVHAPREDEHQAQVEQYEQCHHCRIGIQLQDETHEKRKE